MEKKCTTCLSNWDIGYIDDDNSFIVRNGEIINCPNCLNNFNTVEFYDNDNINNNFINDDFDINNLFE